jgi:acetyl esterase/lipase
VHDHIVFTLNQRHIKNQKHILYLHGGAYVEGFVKPHWDFLYMLMQNLDCVITAPDYPLAPAHTFEQSFAMVSEIYKDLSGTTDSKNLILMGDSSGGGFALALAQLIRNEHVPQPGQIILLSPWLDISLTNPGIKDVDPSDYFLGVEGLKMAGEAYAGGTSPDYYLLSPIYGSLEGLAKISLFIGSREILVADARKLKNIAEEKGIAITYNEYPGMFHAWMLLNLPESKKAKKEIVDLIRSSSL